jgi:hypothetical protein
MAMTIKCDRMPDGWNYNTCFGCNHFTLTLTNKGRQWRCSLNNETAKARREFRLIWALEYLRLHGIAATNDNNIIVEYIGKRKVKKKQEDKENGKQ